MDKIAVFLQDNNSLASFFTANRITVFQKNDGWAPVSAVALSRPLPTAAKELRQYTQALCKKLSEEHKCRIIAGTKLSGIVYNELDRFGLYLFEISDYNGEVFDGIIADVAQLSAAKPVALAPLQTEVDGIFTFDMAAAQREKPELSSKMLLKPFLENTPFLSLELICDHIPPWIASEYDVKNTAQIGRLYRCTIVKKQK